MTETEQNAPLDLQEHLPRLEAKGLLTRPARSTRIPNFIRLRGGSFRAACPRRTAGFLFTDVVGALGETYDIPVAGRRTCGFS